MEHAEQVETLLKMLSLCRAHGSDGEKKFVQEFLGGVGAVTYVDAKGEVLAYVVHVGDVQANPVLFSSHVDTVHPTNAPLYQQVIYDAESQFIYKDTRKEISDGMPLGADCAAGVWLMLEMIRAGVPGAYIFHRGEERGGIGSRGMAEHHKAWLSQFQYTIAFDRRGDSDVITEMAVGRTCSDAFAELLANRLNMNGLFAYAPCPNGIFTDTANYRRIIPECTNLSVGYDSEHSVEEYLDLNHLLALRDALIDGFKDGVGWLQATRKVTDDDDAHWGNWEYSYYGKGTSAKSNNSIKTTWEDEDVDIRDEHDVLSVNYKDLVKWVRLSAPEDIADLLCQLSEDLAFARDRMLN